MYSTPYSVAVSMSLSGVRIGVTESGDHRAKSLHPEPLAGLELVVQEGVECLHVGEFGQDLQLFFLRGLLEGEGFELSHQPLLFLVIGDVHRLEADRPAVDFLQPIVDVPQGPLWLLGEEARDLFAEYFL